MTALLVHVAPETASTLTLFLASNVQGLRVCNRDDTHFEQKTITSVLILPSNLSEIKENAFQGITVEAIIVPDSCKSIEANAFKDCHNLAFVSLPGECVFDPTAFNGCNDLLFDVR